MNFVKFCKHEPKMIKKIDGVHYMGASQAHALDFTGDLMINFTKASDMPSVMNIPELAKFVDVKFEEIMVPWPDFGTPKVDPGFWKALHEYIISRDFAEVCFHCEAGHGRTGTALSAMLVACCGYSALEAVGHVRTIYCEEAVESWPQAIYLQELDEYYNNREMVEEDCPTPSMVIAAELRKEEEKKKLIEKYSKFNSGVEECKLKSWSE